LTISPPTPAARGTKACPGDLTPLAGLTSLTHLDLRVNQISDLTPLAGLPSLSTRRESSGQHMESVTFAELAMASVRHAAL